MSDWRSGRPPGVDELTWRWWVTLADSVHEESTYGRPDRAPECDCGCGKKVGYQQSGVWSRFARGHHRRPLANPRRGQRPMLWDED